MRGGIVAGKLPRAEQETDHPAIRIRSLFGRPLIDPIVKSVENEACGPESASYGDGEPSPEKKKQNEKDDDGKPKISS